MALTPSKRLRNFTAVQHGSTTITGVKKITNNNQAGILQDAADMDLGPTHTALIFLNPHFNVMSNHALITLAVLSGVTGVFTFTLADSKNLAQAGGGAMVFTTNSLSIIGERTIEGDYNQLATESFSVMTTWADGVTNPVGTAAA